MFRSTKREILGQPDWILLFATFALIALGLMAVYSSTSDMGYREFDDAAYFFKRQVMWLAVGLVAMFLAARLPYRHWMKLSIPFMLVALGLLVFLVLTKQGRLLVGRILEEVEKLMPSERGIGAEVGSRSKLGLYRR